MRRNSKRTKRSMVARVGLIVLLALMNIVSIPWIQAPGDFGSPNVALAEECPVEGPCETDLAVTKTADVSEYTPGGTIEYTITIANTGEVEGQYDLEGATLEDEVPAEITDVEWTCEATGSSSCGAASGDGNTINATYDILEGETVTYTVTGTAPTGDPPPELTNTAIVAVPAEATDLDDSNNESTVVLSPTDVSVETDLSITKIAEPDPYVPGEGITFIITVSNVGADVTGANVADNIPADITAVEWTCTGADGGVCEASGTGNNIDIDVDLPDGASVEIEATGTAPDEDPPETIDNTATVSPPDGVIDTDDTNDSATIQVEPAVVLTDLEVVKTGGPDPYSSGEDLTFTITVNNTGADVDDANLVDTVPAEISNVEWTCTGAAGGDCTASGNGNEIDELVDLPGGASVEFVVTGEAPVGVDLPLLSNTALITAPEGVTDTDETNNESTVELVGEGVIVNPTPFVCDGTPFIAQLNPSTLYNVDTSVNPYELSVVFEQTTYLFNGIGYNPADDLIYASARISESNEPLGIAVMDADGNVGIIGYPDGLPEDLVWHNGTVSDDGSTYYLRSTDDVYAVDLETFEVTSETPDPNVGTADLAYGPDGLLYGGSGSGLVTINPENGSTSTTSVTGLPATNFGAAWFNASGELFLYDNNTGNGSGWIYHIDLNAAGGPAVIGESEAPLVSQNDGTSCTQYEPSADLEMTKTADSETVDPGDELTYTLEVWNDGPDSAQPDVVVSDTLPDNVEFVDATGTDWTCVEDSGAVNCDHDGSLGLGAAEPITVIVQVPFLAGTQLTNTASISSPTPDPNLDDNEDEVSTTVSQPPGTPFVCDGAGYIVQDPGNQLTAQFYRVNTGQLPYTFDEFGPLHEDTRINAIGYSSIDNMLYGWQVTIATPTNIIDGLVRIDADGLVTEIGVPDGVAEEGYHVGTVSDDGSTYYFKNNNVANRMYAVDLATLDVTEITLDEDLVVADFAEHPQEPGVLYGTSGDDLHRVVLNESAGTGTVSTVEIDGYNNAGGVGAAWFTADGDFIAYANTGTVFQFDLDDPNNPTQVARVEDAPSSGSNDGASCTARDPSADLSVTKEADPDPVQAGEPLTYTISVFNGGPDNATGVEVIDTLPEEVSFIEATGSEWTCIEDAGEVSCVPDGPLGLGPAPPITVTVIAPTSSTDGLVNTVTVDSSTEDPDPGNNEDETTTTVEGEPEIDVEKVVTEPRDELVVDDVLEYAFTVTNTGDVDLTDISVEDPLIPDLDCSVDALAPDESFTCFGSYTVTQDDVDDGEIINTATVTGTPPDGPPIEEEDEEEVPGPRTADLTIDKIAGGAPPVLAGDVIIYTFEVQNTGNVTLTDVVVTDPLIPDLICIEETLAPFASFDCMAEYTVTQEDVDAGSVLNEATVTGEPPPGVDPPTEEDEEETDIEQNPDFAVDKEAEGGVDELILDDVITYTFVVTNTGNVTLSNVDVSDPLIPGLECTVAELAPGETLECTDTYTVTQADVDRGEIVNVATVTGEPPNPVDPPIEEEDEETVPDPEQEPDIRLLKSAEPIADIAVGEVITFNFEVTNTGDVTLTDVEVTDDLISGLSCTTVSLAPNESFECSDTYTVTQTDVDRGEVVNQASVTGVPPSGPPVENEDEERVPGPEQESDIDIDKSAEDLTELILGDEITYTFEVANSGNVTLTNVEVTDPLIPELDCTVESLAPGETFECSATYVVTQEDVDRGEIVNDATVTGEPPIGPPIEEEDREIVPDPEQDADISIDKVAEQVSDIEVGDVITYNFYVTNTGDVTLTDVSVDDPLIPSLECTIAELAPGEGFECSATYTITQSDVNAGEVLNTATVTGTPPEGPPIEEEDEEQVPGPPKEPGLSIDKSAEAVTELTLGDEITYTFVVTNTGNLTLTDVDVSDELIPGLECATDALAPGESFECTATYTVTEADVERGEVVNVATVTGDPPDGGVPPEDEDTERVPTPEPEPEPETGVSVDKIATQVDELVAGETITYTFIVTNTGDEPLLDVSVSDPLIPDLNCTVEELAPGETLECTATYTVTDADVANGQVVNTAEVSGSTPDGDDVSGDDEAIVPGPDEQAGIEIEKSADPSEGVTAGDEITYTFIVTNTGDVALHGVGVDDPLIPDVICPATTLDPGESMTCTGTYTVTDADVEAGSVSNSATAVGESSVAQEPPSSTDTVVVEIDEDDPDSPDYPQLPPNTGVDQPAASTFSSGMMLLIGLGGLFLVGAGVGMNARRKFVE